MVLAAGAAAGLAAPKEKPPAAPAGAAAGAGAAEVVPKLKPPAAGGLAAAPPAEKLKAILLLLGFAALVVVGVAAYLEAAATRYTVGKYRCGFFAGVVAKRSVVQ